MGALPDDIAAQLAPNERVEVVLRGVHGQRMYGTDRRVFVYKKGWLAHALLGHRVASWDYRNISGITMDRGALYGVVAIHAGGVNPANLRYHSSNKAEDAFSVPHAIPVARIWDELEVAVSRLRELVADAQRGSSQVTEDFDLRVAKLHRLAQLHEQGLITDDQLERKKAEILSRP